MLYDFKNKVVNKSKRSIELLSSFLDRNGYPSASPHDIHLMRVDLRREENENNIIFREDGVYLIRNGIEYRGYMYLKRYWITFEGRTSFPRFHITKCSTVLEIEKRIDFVWDNTHEAEIQDRSSGKIYKANLDLCWNCQSETNSKIKTIQDFYKEIHVDEQKIQLAKKVETDINGYELGKWSNISRNFKEQKRYTCEKCNIQMVGFDKHYIHTDHKNGDKTMNVESNFECLCILCHCYKDEHHRENFGKKRMKRELQSYVEKFRQDLLNLGNKYLKQYDRDNK
jgi:hypothetical protein